MSSQETLELNLECNCTDTKTFERIKLNIDPKEVQSVRDLQIKIQGVTRAPVCDQKLYYLDHLLSDPSSSLSELYVRGGDTICVEYSAKVDLKEFNDNLTTLKKFLIRVPYSVVYNEDARFKLRRVLKYNLPIAIDNLGGMFQQESKTAKGKASRHYFVQENGLNLIMKVLSSLKDDTLYEKCGIHYSGMDDEDDYHRAASDDDDNEDDVDMRSNNDGGTSNDGNEEEIHVPLEMHHGSAKNDKENDEEMTNNARYENKEDEASIANRWKKANPVQVELYSQILYTLWVFITTSEDVQLILKAGGFQVISDAFFASGRSMCTYWDHLCELTSSALGCMASCVEHDWVSQRILVKDQAIVKRLIAISETSRLQGPKERFYSQAAAYALFHCTFDVKALEVLINNKVHKRVMLKLQENDGNSAADMMISYYFLFILARVCSSPLCSLEDDENEEINQKINEFMTKYNFYDVCTWEQVHNCVWETLTPVIHLAFASGLKHQTETISQASKEEKTEISHEAPIKKRMVTCQVAAADMQHETADISEVSTTASWLGSLGVQKFGLFSLQLLFLASDKRELLLSEDLLPYLVCLQWQLSGAEQEILKTELANFREVIRPPSLKVISKSLLAQKEGFDAVVNL